MTRNALELVSPTVRGSRLAALSVGEFAFRAVRGEHLTMRGLACAVGIAVWPNRDANSSSLMVRCSPRTALNPRSPTVGRRASNHAPSAKQTQNSLTSCREEEAAPVDDTEVTHSMNGPDFPDLNRAQGKASMLRE
jgi:hypothetical protein